MSSYLGASIITGILLVLVLIGTAIANELDCQKVVLFEDDPYESLGEKITFCESQIESLNMMSFIINIPGLGVIIFGVIMTFIKPKNKRKVT